MKSFCYYTMLIVAILVVVAVVIIVDFIVIVTPRRRRHFNKRTPVLPSPLLVFIFFIFYFFIIRPGLTAFVGQRQTLHISSHNKTSPNKNIVSFHRQPWPLDATVNYSETSTMRPSDAINFNFGVPKKKKMDDNFQHLL